MTRMRVVLEDVTCWNTEDIHGADSFYVLGAVTCGRDKESIVTKPFQINDGQTFRFPLPNFNTVFYKDVPANEYLRISLAAFDEDAAIV
ncbi:Uncharacterised protein [uncultured archaeon]|nr:Uncharacterised protein [uncultured archaeon]